MTLELFNMTRNLDTADTLAKLLLSICTVVLYFAGIIAGPFALLLFALSMVIISIYLIGVVYKILSRRKPSGR